jgi:molecular chaperone DnaK
MGKIIGIDLGTTNSCVAVVKAANHSYYQCGRKQNNSFCSWFYKGWSTSGRAIAKRQAITNPKYCLLHKKIYGKRLR